MGNPLKETGDRIRDDAELTGEKIKSVKSILYKALRDAPVEHRKWAQYIGQALEEAEQAEGFNDSVKGIIYESRRRAK